MKKANKIITNNFPTQCYEVAPPSYYLDINKFNKCDISCSLCIDSPTNCSNQIPNWYYLDISIYKKCDISCSTCIGWTINDCLQCAPNYYKISTHKFPTQCYNNDISGYYFDIDTYKKCDISCLTCIGGLINDCKECA